MPCCTTNTKNFVQESVTTVPYTGLKPTVDVLYLQPDNTFIGMGVFTQIEITATDVIVSHGGAASGIVKLTQ